MDPSAAQANFECAAYTALMPEVALHDDLMRGTKAMREKGYLKKFPIEPAEVFKDRNAQAVLFNKYEKCVFAMCGLITKRPAQLTQDESNDKKFFAAFSRALGKY